MKISQISKEAIIIFFTETLSFEEILETIYEQEFKFNQIYSKSKDSKYSKNI